MLRLGCKRARKLCPFLPVNNALYNKATIANPPFGTHWQNKRYTDLDFTDNWGQFADKGSEM